MPVYQLVQMPVSEYYRWSAFMREKTRRQVGEADVREMKPEQIAAAFGADF
jgi:hypothetical protein